MLHLQFRENIEEILDNIKEGVHIVDSKGRSVFYNKFAAALDNINPEQAIGRHLLEIYPSLTKETSTILRVLETGEPILNNQQSFKNYKGVLITTINSTIPLKSGKKIIGALEISMDITEVKKLSEKVLDLQAELLSDKKTKKMQDGTRAVYDFSDIIGTSDAMLKLKKEALSVASSPSPVMIYGDTGTGKELLVHAIHNASRRKNAPFVAQNCAALPETLLESILFGTVKGSFTGAENRMGLFELADGGTLFLDEINSMPIALQAKLLRVIQDGNVRRIGDTKVTHVNVRIMTAINISPKQALSEKSIRDDLFYRLSVISLHMPSLKERTSDIPLLITHFINKYNKVLDKKIKGITKALEDFFLSYMWPGNVRELEHAIEGAMNIAESNILDENCLPYYLLEIQKKDKSTINKNKIFPLNETISRVEELMIKKAIKKTGGNITKSAELLDIPRQTLQYKISKYKINVQSQKD